MNQIRNKIIFGVVAIAVLFSVTTMGGMAWMISRQYSKAAHEEMLRAERVIEQSLQQQRQQATQIAGQLAGMISLGSTLWYLEQDVAANPETPAVRQAYLDMMRDCRRLLEAGKLNRLAIYDREGQLVVYALQTDKSLSVGYRTRGARPQGFVSRLTEGQSIVEARFVRQDQLDGAAVTLPPVLPDFASLGYVSGRQSVLLEAFRPIIPRGQGAAAQPGLPLGTVRATFLLDDAQLLNWRLLTDTHINLYTPAGLAAGTLPGPVVEDWQNMLHTARLEDAGTAAIFNGANFERAFIPLGEGGRISAMLTVLKSNDPVIKNIEETLFLLGAITAIGLLLLLPLAYYFATSLSQPLTLLGRLFRQAPLDTAKLAESDRKALAHTRLRTDEIGRLAENLLEMNDEADRQIRLIASINSSLELSVGDRTREVSRRAQEIRALVESAPNGVGLFRDTGECLLANESLARHSGMRLEAMLAASFRLLSSTGPYANYVEAIRYLAADMTLPMDIVRQSEDGQELTLACVFKRILIDGEPHLLLITNDITERTRVLAALNNTMRQLEAKELAKTRFLAAAGHDLRQPLAAARLFIDALELTPLDHKQTRILESLQKSMVTFNGLLDALLNISKLDAGVIRPELRTLPVAELMAWVDETFTTPAEEKQLTLRLHFPLSGYLAVHSDGHLVKSVLMNLISNAIRYTNHGSVLVSARRVGDRVRFQVWDTGVGIDAAHRDRIFDEFYQVDNPQRDRSQGLGLGLSIVRRALDLLGARIECRSRSGHGTMFSFSLPRAEICIPQPQEWRLPESSERKPDATTLSGALVLLVEDDMMVAEAMINYLEQIGARVSHHVDAESALIWSLTERFDYVVADYMLAGKLNGMAFLRQLQERESQRIKAVLLTGDTSATTLKQAAQLPWPLLHKPVEMVRLLALLLEQDAQPV